MARRNPKRDHAQDVYEKHLGTRRKSRTQELLDEEDAEEIEDDDEEGLESQEAGGEQLPPGGNESESGGGQGDTTEEGDDSEGDEEVRDPVAKAVANTEARMRKKYVKPLRQEVERLKEQVGTVRSLRLENEFLRLAGGAFHDASAAFKLADTSQVKVADDGTVTGMDAVVTALAESHPYLVRDEAADDEEDTYEPPDLPSGRPMNSGRKTSVSGPKTNDAALLRKYPALQRRRGW